MIVSHRHRFVFFAVPRTGTHAVRTALQPFPAAIGLGRTIATPSCAVR